MKPCPRCGTAIPVKAATCDDCVGKPPALQLAPCKTVSQDELQQAHDYLADATNTEDMTLISLAVVGALSLPLAMCYLFAGPAGAAAALLVGVALLVAAWAAMGGGC